ncbi:hypothetical protein AAVH_07156 [Aphelenchoides avenae]|nr:hypothetical protein AAVH_07156 [Aphelenchus avenae]
MRYLNSHLALRLLQVVLLVILVVDLPLLWDIAEDWLDHYGEIARTQKLAENKTGLQWSDVDILSPPDLNDTMMEAYRLNEILAHSAYNCKDKRSVGGSHDSFILCFDEPFRTKDATKTMLLTGLTDTRGAFEQELNSSQWTVYIPQDNRVIDLLQGTVEIHYLTELSEYHYLSMDRILEDLREDYEFGVAKVELYSPMLKDSEQLKKAPKHLENVLVFLKAKQLLVSMHIEKANGSEVIPIWYRTLYRMFFNYGYVVVGAESNGACGRALGHCQYRASFVKASVYKAKEAPPFGMGSPAEERYRLLNYLSSVEGFDRCSNFKSSSAEVPLTCETHLSSPDCTVVYIRYRLLTEPSSVIDAYGRCSVHLFYPEPTDMRFPTSLRFASAGISTKPGKTEIVPGLDPRAYWQLKPLEDLLKPVEKWTHHTVLALDLNGSEWDTLEALTDQSNCITLKKFQQIAFRLRLWFGEENSSYRRFYLWFLRLERCGFMKTISLMQNSTTHFVTYKLKEARYR